MLPANVAPEACDVLWTVTDPTGAYNVLHGFNAAHIFDDPGTYPIACTVTAPDGTKVTAARTVVIAANDRTPICVDAAAGSDTNPGTAAAPMQTLGKAMSLLKPSSEIRLHCGQTFSVASTINVRADHVRVCAYGDGTAPIITWTAGKSGGGAIFAVTGNDDCFDNLTFDAPSAAVALPAGIATVTASTQPSTQPSISLAGLGKIAPEGICPDAFRVGGSNITIRGCTFLNVGYGVNANLNPIALLVQDCNAPLLTGLRGYLLWYQGSDIVAIGNTVANSTCEHCIRGGNGSGSVERVNVSLNRLTNLTGKGTIVIQTNVHFASVYGNTCTGGPIGAQPLGGPDAIADHVPPAADTAHVRIAGNSVTRAVIQIGAGASDIYAVNNRITDGGFVVPAADPSYPNRFAKDVVIDHNTIVLATPATFVSPPAPVGRALFLLGPFQNFQFTNNLMIAPHLVVGGYQSGGAYILNTLNLSSLTIGGNVWPDPGKGRGTNTVAALGDNGQRDTLAAWNQRPFVNTPDVQANVILDSSGLPPANVSAGAR